MSNHISAMQKILTILNVADLIEVVSIVIIFGALSLISTMNYVLFHSIVEVAGIAVAFSIFIIVWNTRRKVTDGFFLIVGISFLFFGIIDLIHMLAYKGMGVFPGNSSDLPTQLWIAGRYFQSISFLVATLFIGRFITRDRKYDAGIIIASCTAVCTLFFASIFVWQNFPHCFIEGSGLTMFKIGSEYIISLILIATIIILYLKREHFDPIVWKLLIAAQVFLIFGELAFTSYVSVYGFMNLLGHLFRLVSVYLFYRAFVVISLTHPYDLILHDVKVNEERLRESEAKNRAIYESSHDSLMLLNEKGFLDCNPRTLQMFCLKSREEFIKYHPAELSPPTQPDGRSSWDAAVEHIRSAFRNGIDQFEWVHRRNNGEDFPAEVLLSVLDYGKKRILQASVRDITDRKRAEKALCSSEERFRGIASNLPGIVFQFYARDSGEWGMYFVDGHSRDVYSLSPEPLDTWYDRFASCIAPEDRKRWVESIINVVNKVAPWEFEGRFIKSTGEEIYIRGLSQPVRLQNETVWNGILLDITDHRRAEEELRRLYTELEQRVVERTADLIQVQESFQKANEKLNLLNSITRHDILNQLMSLSGFLELSGMEVSDAVVGEYIRKAQQAADTIERHISFTKQYQDIGVKTPLWQNVREYAENPISDLLSESVTFVADLDDIELYADPLFEKVLYTLIDNTLRHGEKVTGIRLSYRMTKTGELVLIYEDNGIGIKDEDKERIFERGFGKNTGFGLFLAKEILLITGLIIQETGDPGKGARFEILVPKGGYRFAGNH